MWPLKCPSFSAGVCVANRVTGETAGSAKDEAAFSRGRMMLQQEEDVMNKEKAFGSKQSERVNSCVVWIPTSNMNTVLASPRGSEEYKYLLFMLTEEDSSLVPGE